LISSNDNKKTHGYRKKLIENACFVQAGHILESARRMPCLPEHPLHALSLLELSGCREACLLCSGGRCSRKNRNDASLSGILLPYALLNPLEE